MNEDVTTKNKAYPKYNPSGVEWLGDVPEHWGVKALKYLFENLDYRRIPLAGEDRAGIEKIFPYYGASGIIDYVDDYIYDETLILVAEDGANLLSRSTPLAFRAEGKYWVNNHAHILRPKYDAITYWESILQIFDYTPYVTGSAQPKLTSDNLGSFILPVPPFPEQRAIAAFLDHETGRIDSLITKKQRLLELLAEQRTALISRAVTKGLDATVKLKPSDVEWLGDVPAHWGALPLKRIVAIPVTDGPHETPEILDEGIPFVSAEAIRSNKIDFSRKRGFIAESEHHRFCLKYHPKRDDIYMIKSGATTGNLAIVETDEEFSIWSPLAVVRVHKKKAAARFVLAAMNSKEFQTSVQLFWSFGTQQNIGMNVIENLPIPLPPLPEQQAIAAFLDRETAKIDTLSAKVVTVIERLKEYRTALISSVVTGKIDVSTAINTSVRGAA